MSIPRSISEGCEVLPSVFITVLGCIFVAGQVSISERTAMANICHYRTQSNCVPLDPGLGQDQALAFNDLQKAPTRGGGHNGLAILTYVDSETTD